MKTIDISAKPPTRETNQATVSCVYLHPEPPHPATMRLFTITTDDGTQGPTIVGPSTKQ